MYDLLKLMRGGAVPTTHPLESMFFFQKRLQTRVSIIGERCLPFHSYLHSSLVFTMLILILHSSIHNTYVAVNLDSNVDLPTDGKPIIATRALYAS